MAKISIAVLAFFVAASSAGTTFPKKYDPLLHGKGKKVSTYSDFPQKYEYKMQAPEDNSYDAYKAIPEDAMLPPAEYPYLNSEGEAHGELAPPPETLEADPLSSYLEYSKSEDMEPLSPPPLSSYSVLPENKQGVDAMSLLRFMVRALPTGSSYSKYQADPEPETMSPPDQLPQSTYLGYVAERKSESIQVPDVESPTEKSVSSYSSYE